MDKREILPNTVAVPVHLGKVLVLGLGKSGKSAARYCANLVGGRVDSLFIAAGARNADTLAFVESLAAPGVSWEFGDDALKACTEHFDLCIASPGIPYWHELYQAGLALSQELISEVEFAWRESAANSTWVAITGTNGKTTTTALAAFVLQECGLSAAAVGNIGDVCLDAVAAGNVGVYVAEVSSYQLYSTRDFAPDVVVMLNITPDHLHWHRTFEAYRDAKFCLFDHMNLAAENSPLPILDATNPVVRAKVRELKAQDLRYLPLGASEGIREDMRAKCGATNAAFLNADGRMIVALDGVEHDLGSASDLQIKGEHNVSNALAAASVAVALGMPDARVAAALAAFQPLAHRIEPCGSVNGVRCYNDSKATNVDATLKAIEAFPDERLVVLLGGDDKGTELDSLVKAAQRHAHAVVCFGQAGPRFARAFEQEAASAPEGFSLLSASKLADALETALEVAAPGDVVLLSPACASFDEFSSFEQRGNVFKQLVADHATAAHAAAECATVDQTVVDHADAAHAAAECATARNTEGA